LWQQNLVLWKRVKHPHLFSAFDGAVSLSDEAVEGFIKNTLNLRVQ
jgi:hypothetical protein